MIQSGVQTLELTQRYPDPSTREANNEAEQLDIRHWSVTNINFSQCPKQYKQSSKSLNIFRNLTFNIKKFIFLVPEIQAYLDCCETPNEILPVFNLVL
jgi:hypothetical protein